VSKHIESDHSGSAVILSVAGAIDLSVEKARGLCAGAFIVSANCLAYGAITSVSSSVFKSFVIPTVLGAISGVVLLGVLLAREKPRGSWDVAELLGKVGSVVFIVLTLSPFLPRWTAASWWSLLGGGLMLLGLVLLVELLKASKTRMPDPSQESASTEFDA
jgi:hypothetical protein